MVSYKKTNYNSYILDYKAFEWKIRRECKKMKHKVTSNEYAIEDENLN